MRIIIDRFPRLDRFRTMEYYAIKLSRILARINALNQTIVILLINDLVSDDNIANDFYMIARHVWKMLNFSE